MKRYGTFFLALLLSVALLSSGSISPAFSAQTGTSLEIAELLTGDYVEGQALILYKSNPHLRAASPLAGLRIEQQWDFNEPMKSESGNLQSNAFRRTKRIANETEKVALVSKEGVTTEQLLTELAQNSAVLLAQPNYIDKPLTNDTFYDSQWSLHDTTGGIHTPTVWESSHTYEENVVAVVDTGVDYTHPDLRDKMWTNPGNIGLPGTYGYDFASNDDDPMPDDAPYSYSNSHGTHCAGEIAAQIDNAQGIAGVSPNTKIMALKVALPNGGFLTSACIGAYEYIYQAKKAGVNIVAVNNSWGGNEPIPVFNYVLDKVGQAGVLSVIAAGNDSKNNDENFYIPANSQSPYTITVAAGTKENTLAKFTCYGKTSVDLAAPGTTMLSTVARDMYIPMLSEQAGLEKNVYYETFAQPPVYEEDALQIGENLSIINPALFTFSGGEYVQAPYDGKFSLTENGYDGTALSLDLSSARDSQAAVKFQMRIKNPYYQSAVPDQTVYASFLTSSPAKDKGGRNNVVVQQIDQNGEYIELGDFVSSGSYQDAWNAPMTALSIDPTDMYIRLEVSISPCADAQRISFDCLGIGFTTGKYGLMSGTSMAAPITCGAVALLSSIYPEESPLEIRARILGGTQPLTDEDTQKVASGGRLDLAKAISDPNPVPDFITLQGNTAVLSGHFMDGASLYIDGTLVTPQLANANEIVFDASPFADDTYHTICLSKNGRAFYLKQFFASSPEKFQAETAMPQTSADGTLLSGGTDLFYIGLQGEFLYRMTKDGWDELPPCPLPATDNMQFVYTDGGIWGISGFTYGAEESTTLVRYDIAANKWEYQDTLIFTWRSSDYSYCSAYNGKLYFFNAGLKEGDVSRQFSVYDPVTKMLENAADFPADAPYSKIVMQQIADKLVVIMPEFAANMEDVYLQPYIFDGSSWTEGKRTEVLSYETAHRLLNTACAASGDKLIFTGVALEGYGSTVAYDPSASVWEGIGYEPLTSDSIFSAAVLGDRYYVMQPGSNGENYLSSMPVTSNLRTITVIAGQGGTVQGSATVYNGDSVTVTAVPESGNTFAGWSENGVLASTAASYTFCATANKELTAAFSAETAPTNPTTPTEPSQPTIPVAPTNPAGGQADNTEPGTASGTAINGTATNGAATNGAATINGKTPFTGDVTPVGAMALLCIVSAVTVAAVRNRKVKSKQP